MSEITKKNAVGKQAFCYLGTPLIRLERMSERERERERERECVRYN